MDARTFLGALRLRLRLVLLAGGSARILLWGQLAFLAIAVLDWVNALPGWLRIAALGMVVVSLALVFCRRLLRPLSRRMDDAALAALAERRLPLDGLLFSAVEGLPLAESDRLRLVERCTPLTARALVRADRLRPWFGGLAALVLVFGGLAVACPGWLAVAAGRVLAPWDASIQHVRTAALDGGLERVVVPADEPLVFAVRRTRGGSAALRLSAEPLAGGEVQTQVAGSLDGPWREQLMLPVGAWRLTAESGDSLPLTATARVVGRPAVMAVTAVIRPPAYARETEQRVAGAVTLTALAGSQIEIGFAFSRDGGARDHLEWARYDDAALTVATGPTGSRLVLDLRQAGTLTLGALDRHDDAGSVLDVAADPALRIPVRLRDDAVPRVHLDGPVRNEAVTAEAVVRLAARAHDDLGLASLAILAQAGGAATGGTAPGWRSLAALDALGKDDQARLDADLPHDLTVSSLAASGEIVLVAEARDANDITGPGIGRSEPLTLRVVAPEVLRQELDRVLAEVRDRLVLARDQLAAGLADAGQAPPAARAGRLVARRAGEQLATALRRWRENRLDGGEATVLTEADALVGGAMSGPLAAAAEGGAEARNQLAAGDQALGKAERMISGLLRSGDLLDRLLRIQTGQQRLAADTSAFILAHLTGDLDAAAKGAQSVLVDRQQDLAGQLKEWEGRLLDSEVREAAEAKPIVRSEQPAALLSRAGQALAAARGRREALDHQARALQVIADLVKLLRGAQDAGDAAARAGELAKREEAVAAALARGQDPAALAAEQAALADDVAAFARELAAAKADAEAAAAVAAAAGEAGKATQALQSGQGEQGGQSAGAASALLREAQRELGGGDEKAKEQTPATDVLGVLRQLRDRQRKAVAQATTLDQAFAAERAAANREVEDPALTFGESRRVLPLTEIVDEVQLRLQEEALKPVAENPIAARGLRRIESALAATLEHLRKPALGRRGVQLTTIALAEIERLLDIAEALPRPDKKDGGESGKGGEPQSDNAPFPPAVMVNLLVVEQEELRDRVAVRAPGDLAARQREVADLILGLAGQTRPGSRPGLLLARSLRAASSAGHLLGAGGRGTEVLNEQDAAAAALRRLLEEAAGQSSSSSSRGGAPPRPPEKGGTPPKPAAGEQQPGQGAQAAKPNAGGEGEAGKGGASVEIEEVGRGGIRLPKASRERLDEASRLGLPAEGIQLYRRFLELLETR